VAKAVKWALPIWLQKPLLAFWRAPVSSTVIQAALAREPGAQHLAHLLVKAVMPSGQQADELASRPVPRPSSGRSLLKGAERLRGVSERAPISDVAACQHVPRVRRAA
jgi:hypothetical protein